ncbi:protein phosphatase 1 regulatory subunit 37 [Limanda limanda]|uniref:protein phosphatase 1 regulatory subunit 37 n=1 Tax=Limanda limanda TaxID=27771 RepID=UPI0029C61379|nr:protein phosphatase 1 regulatory subunit 37 [Limanda limanda]
MNIEEQRLDLCNAKTRSNVDEDHNTTNNTEGVTPRICELMTDSNTEKRIIVPTEASDTYVMPELTDNLQAAEENNHQVQDTLEIDELNGNGTSTAQNTPVIANPTDFIFSNEEHKGEVGVEEMKEEKDTDVVVGGRHDGGDPDTGVALSLDKSAELEADSPSATSLSDNDSESESPSQDVPAGSTAESLSNESQPSSTESPATDQVGLYPTVEEADDKHKPSGKRVTFPSDEDIVSGAVEPKDPWRHAQNVTVEEIISSYKQACQKLNCKPIPKVLKQIQELKDLTQRNECLDLKGEKLDYKACESLEEILKRVQFKVIDLEQTNLDEDGASALFDMIEYYESATHLNISFNKHIGTRGWQAAAHMMRKTSSLQYLDAHNTPLLDHSAPFVARALRISGSLAVLHLENAGISGRPLMLLATALKMNMNLRELYLADNKLNGLQDSAQLGNLLKFNYNIQILDLRNNHILDSGLSYVCEGLKEQRRGLVTLVLWNNQLTHNGMGYLAAALPCTQSLETLNLGHNSVGNEGVHRLKDGLIANRSVLRLGLASTKLSCEGAVAVAEFIAESPRLLRLDLRENEIKTGGLMALSLALKVNTSLLRLDLDREPKRETVKSFIETQRALLAEIQNGCKRNFILAKEKEETEQKMRQSASMAEIATEDGTTEEEEGEAPASEAKDDKEGKEGEIVEVIETTGKEEQACIQAGASSETNVESDSDTEDDEEEEEEVITKSCSTNTNQAAPQTQQGAVQPPLSASGTSSSPSDPPAGGPCIIPDITITESPAPPGTPPSPGRSISVSSPGRGRKVFTVTRVESPPYQQQQQLELQRAALAALSQTKELSKKPMTPPASETPTETQQTQEDVKEHSPAPALSTDCTLTEQSSIAHSESTVNTPLTHTETQSTSPPTEDVTASTLDPKVTDPNLQAPALPSDSSAAQAGEVQLTEDVIQSTQSPQPENTSVEGEEEKVEDGRELMSPDSTEEECKQSDEPSQTHDSVPAVDTQPPKPVLEQLQIELASVSMENQSPHQTQEEEEEKEASAPLSEIENPTSTEEEDNQPNQEEPSPKQQTEADEESVKPVLSVLTDQEAPAASQSDTQETSLQAEESSERKTVLSVLTDQQAPAASQSDTQETSLQAEESSESPESASTGSVSPVKVEDSADESSADECFPEALDQEEVNSALPNGLKPEFSLHLLDPESPKPGSCVMEHVSVSCTQDLEELLLEASLETGRDAP